MKNKPLISLLLFFGLSLGLVQQALANAHIYIGITNDSSQPVYATLVGQNVSSNSSNAVIAPGQRFEFDLDDNDTNPNSAMINGLNGASLYYYHNGGDPNITSPSVITNQQSGSQSCSFGGSWVFDVIQANGYKRPLGACPQDMNGGPYSGMCLGNVNVNLSSPCDANPGIHFETEIPPDSLPLRSTPD